MKANCATQSSLLNTADVAYEPFVSILAVITTQLQN